MNTFYKSINLKDTINLFGETMKSEMTNVDICCAVNELQKLVNGRLDKAF